MSLRGWWAAHRQAAWIDLPLRTYDGWSDDGVPRLSASLSYYTVFSIAPLLVVVIGVLGLVVTPGVLEEHLVHEAAGLVGDQAAEAIRGLLHHARKPLVGVVSTAISLGVLLLGAVGVFVELKSSLDLIWGVRVRPGLGLRALVVRYFAPMGMVLGIGFLLLVSLVVSAFLAAIAGWMHGHLPALGAIMPVLDQLIACTLFTVLFAMIHAILPDVHLPRRDLLAGALLSGVLFAVGRWAIGQYLGRTSFASSYGAAGSFAVLLVWVYYSAQILFLGAEFCRARLERARQRVAPTAVAEPLPPRNPKSQLLDPPAPG